MTLAAILTGALIGAGTAAAMGGDPKKGAMYGAVGGGIGGAVGPAAAGVPTGFSQAAGAAGTTGAVVGGGVGGAGSTLLKKAGGLGSTLIVPSPITVKAGYAGDAEGQRRRRRRGYGSTILAGGELGVASTRKQILG